MILITGGTGIVGARLAFDLISQGKEVRCTRRPSSDTAFVQRVFEFYSPEKGKEYFSKINWAIADLLNLNDLEVALEGVSEVYHTAAMVSYLKKDRDELIRINGEGTSNVVNLCLEKKIGKLCHISSVAALGKASLNGKSNEKNKWVKGGATSQYSLSKHLAEREVWRGAAEGLNVTIVNPSVILAPAKSTQSSGSLMALLRKGVGYYPPGKTGFVDIRDVSEASIKLMNQEVFNQRFVLNAENITYLELLTYAAETYNKPIPKLRLNSLLLTIAKTGAQIGGIITGKDPKITHETARSAMRSIEYENDKIREALSMDFIPVKDSISYYAPFHP